MILTGVGGIGKTAVAGRVLARLRDDGWLVAVHEGRWNPTALIGATAQALHDGLPGVTEPGKAEVLRAVLARLTDPSTDDGPKLAADGLCCCAPSSCWWPSTISSRTCPRRRDVPGPRHRRHADRAGRRRPDRGAAAHVPVPAARPGPVPGPHPHPALSQAELRRLFLRLPKLRDLEAEDRRLLTRTIGGHPRLIEFTDALLRGGHASFRHVQTRLRDLARAEGLDLREDGRWRRRWIRRCCWAAPTSCSPNCCTC